MVTLYNELVEHTLAYKNKNDKRVFGLVIQGGGMRAVYSAGAIAPLVSYGFANTFDHVIGSSAGAINGAYFIGADVETLHTYTDDLTNKNFVNLLRKDKKVDIDYLVDLVLKHKRPVNIENLLRTHTKLHVVVTDARNGKQVVLSDHHKYIEIYEEFRATAALPLLYDKPVLIDKHLYIDGGVSDLLPIDVAVKLGCTDIVVVMTQQIANYRFNQRHSRLVKRFAKNQPKSIQGKLPTDERMLRANLRRISHPSKKIRFYVLQPSDPEVLVSLATIDKSKVEKLATLGIADMDAFLHAPLNS